MQFDVTCTVPTYVGLAEAVLLVVVALVVEMTTPLGEAVGLFWAVAELLDRPTDEDVAVTVIVTVAWLRHSLLPAEAKLGDEAVVDRV